MFRKGSKVTFSEASGNVRGVLPLTVAHTFRANGFVFHRLDGMPGALFITQSLVAWEA